MEAQLQSIYDEQGRPGAMALRIAARRKGLQVSEAEARAFVSKQSTGQIFRATFGQHPDSSRATSRQLSDSFRAAFGKLLPGKE